MTGARGRLRPVLARAASGFTLVELLIVVVVLAILAGTAGITSGNNAASKLDLAEVTARGAVQHARSLARSSRRPHGVVFDVANDRYTIVDVDGAQIVDPLTRRPFVVDLTSPGQPPGVALDVADFGACGVALVFDAQGVPLTGGQVELLAHGVRRILVCDAATGEVSSQDG